VYLTEGHLEAALKVPRAAVASSTNSAPASSTRFPIDLRSLGANWESN
jgi:hypothetical protein